MDGKFKYVDVLKSKIRVGLYNYSFIYNECKLRNKLIRELEKEIDFLRDEVKRLNKELEGVI